jgi:hypothetical protein
MTVQPPSPGPDDEAPLDEAPLDEAPLDEAPLDDSDEEALSWDGPGSDATYVEGPAVKRAVATPVAVAEDDPLEPPATSSLLLVTYGIIAGVFALYTVGWFTSVQRTAIVMSDSFAQVMYELGEALAVAAPPVWFAVVLVLTRDRKPNVRLLWLLLGLLLLVPVPFVLGS